MSFSHSGKAPLRAMQLEEPTASSSSSITAGRFSIPCTISLTWRSNVGRWETISLLVSQ